MTAMINLTTSKKTDTINVDVKPITNVHVGDRMTGGTTALDAKDVLVTYGDDEGKTEQKSVEIDELKRENEVLKLIIKILQSNPLIVNKYIIADDEVLMHIIKLLCNADDVQIDADDVAQGCFTNNTYRKVHTIYVMSGNETKNLKYDYPSVMKMLQDLRISTKFVF